MIAEANALYDLAVADVEAGDDAFGKNGRNSSGVMRFFEQRLAADRGGNAGARERGEVRRIPHAAGGLPGELRKTLERASVQIDDSGR